MTKHLAGVRLRSTGTLDRHAHPKTGSDLTYNLAGKVSPQGSSAPKSLNVLLVKELVTFLRGQKR